ncbi:MAG: polysaccharide deacetylase family protein [Clostridiales bacterium]|nr:polysaccharide deacetylase family protein [Clostridiales bacterium]
MTGKDRKAGKTALLALILTMLMASSAWADTMGAIVPVTGEQSAPPGSEGTVLASVIISGDAAQAMENQGNQGPGVVSQEETQTGTEGQTELQPAEESQTETGAETATQTSGRDIDPSKPMVALTFDDGPQTSVGNQIMDCLAQYGGKATFFLVGDRVASRASEVQRMVAEGHEVANHTMNHKYLQSLGAAEIQAQVNQCNDVIQSVCGVRPTLMRLPGGNHNATVVANTGMPMIQWSIDTLDWKTRDTASTVSTVLNQVQDGDIVLMHELYEATGNAVLQIVPELVNRGYQIVTVREMAAAKGYSLQAGQLYSALR